MQEDKKELDYEYIKAWAETEIEKLKVEWDEKKIFTDSLLVPMVTANIDLETGNVTYIEPGSEKWWEIYNQSYKQYPEDGKES